MGLPVALVGGPSFRPRRLLPAVFGTVVLGVGWLYLFGLVETILPSQVGLFLFLAIPALVPIVGVGVLTYRGEGILLGWLLGVAFVFGPVVLFLYSGLRKEASVGASQGATDVFEVLLGGVMWSSLFALGFGFIGLVLGGGLRLARTSRN